MRRASNVDANQSDIVKALRKVGAYVAHTHMVGNGFSDLVCGWRGQTLLFELKDGDKPPSERKLTPAQVKFHNEWKGGCLWVVNSVDDALAALRQSEWVT